MTKTWDTITRAIAAAFVLFTLGLLTGLVISEQGSGGLVERSEEIPARRPIQDGEFVILFEDLSLFLNWARDGMMVYCLDCSIGEICTGGGAGRWR